MRPHPLLAKLTAVLLAMPILFGGMSSDALAEPTFELDTATRVYTNPPDLSTLPCEDLGSIDGCFQPYGDKFWVKNWRDRGMAIFWSNFYPTDSKLYRHGACHTSGSGGWYVCNKNMYENSKIRFWVCDSTSAYKTCSGRVETRA